MNRTTGRHPLSRAAAAMAWALGVATIEGCSSCSGTSFLAHDGYARIDVPGLGPTVQLLITDITQSGASEQRARDFYVYEGDRELAHQREVYPGQSVPFATSTRRYRIEVIDYVEHLLHDDEANLCLIGE